MARINYTIISGNASSGYIMDRGSRSENAEAIGAAIARQAGSTAWMVREDNSAGMGNLTVTHGDKRRDGISNRAS